MGKSMEELKGWIFYCGNRGQVPLIEIFFLNVLLTEMKGKKSERRLRICYLFLYVITQIAVAAKELSSKAAN